MKRRYWMTLEPRVGREVGDLAARAEELGAYGIAMPQPDEDGFTKRSVVRDDGLHGRGSRSSQLPKQAFVLDGRRCCGQTAFDLCRQQEIKGQVAQFRHTHGLVGLVGVGQ